MVSLVLCRLAATSPEKVLQYIYGGTVKYNTSPEMSGQREKVNNSRFANIPVLSHRHVWGTSIPSTPDFSQLLSRGIVSTLHLA